jgi:hypothetical protein
VIDPKEKAQPIHMEIDGEGTEPEPNIDIDVRTPIMKITKDLEEHLEKPERGEAESGSEGHSLLHPPLVSDTAIGSPPALELIDIQTICSLED